MRIGFTEHWPSWTATVRNTYAGALWLRKMPLPVELREIQCGAVV